MIEYLYDFCLKQMILNGIVSIRLRVVVTLITLPHEASRVV